MIESGGAGSPPSTMRRSDLMLGVLAVAAVAVLLTAVDASLRTRGQTAALARSADLAQGLGLTDLALFTEARYTRHPSLADLHSPFQDHPMSLEHFPTGSLVPARSPLP